MPKLPTLRMIVAQKRFAFLEWVIFLGLCICGVAITEVIGLERPWEEGIDYTVILFAAIVTALRPAWGRKSFWTSLALIFVLHTLVLFAVLHALPGRRLGLLNIPIGGIEGMIIAGVVWKRMKSLKPQRDAAARDSL